MRVLVTGAAGSIGRVVTVGLADRGHDIVGLDRVPEPEGFDGPWHSVDCADPDAVAAVFAQSAPDAVVHLAGHPGEADLPASFTSHVVTTAALLDAMVEHDVTRIVYASSNHAVGLTPRRDLVSDDARPRPDTFYGVGKVAAEGAAQPVRRPLRHRRRRLPDRLLPRPARAACARSRPGSPTTTACGWSTPLSPRPHPASPCSTASPPTPGPGGTSSPVGGWATSRGTTRRSSRARSSPGPRTSDEAAYVGGPFALAAYHRPALDRT